MGFQPMGFQPNAQYQPFYEGEDLDEEQIEIIKQVEAASEERKR